MFHTDSSSTKLVLVQRTKMSLEKLREPLQKHMLSPGNGKKILERNPDWLCLNLLGCKRKGRENIVRLSRLLLQPISLK